MNATTTEHFLLLDEATLCDAWALAACQAVLAGDAAVGVVSMETLDQPTQAFRPAGRMAPEILYLHTHFAHLRPQGWFLMGRRAEWTPLPADLVHFFGEDWVHAQCKSRGQQSARVVSATIAHPLAISLTHSATHGSPAIQEDYRCYLAGSLKTPG